MHVLIHFGSEVNIIHPGFANKLGLKTWAIDIRPEKIDGSKQDTLGIVIAFFQEENKEERSWFFRKTFFRADISIAIALGMLFFILSNNEINFYYQELG